jgi:SAM-dependent methyltransferase
MISHDEHTERQFGPQAAAYLTSSVHAQGDDLLRVGRSFAGERNARVLDLGCGAGHLSFAIAPQVREVTAYDLSAEMLATVAEAARQRGHANIRTAQGRCESLPFDAASFDAVVTRYSAHHWADLPRALAEMRRVLTPQGRVVVIDAMTPAEPLLDTHLQAIELLRDPSHVRDASLREWQSLLAEAGFALRGHQAWKVRIDFASWIARMRTPADRAAVIRGLWEGAPAEVQRHFEVEPDGSFQLETVQLDAVPVARATA